MNTTITRLVVVLASFALAASSCGPKKPPKNAGNGASSGSGAGSGSAADPGGSASKRDWPKTKRDKIVDTLHGVKVADPYRWLETWKDPSVKAWTRAQDKYARARLAKLPGRDLIAKRLKQLYYIEWVSAPRRKGKRYFFAKRHTDKEKVVYYWRQGPKGKAKVLLDPNTMSKDGSVSVRGVFVSYDGEWAAFKKNANNADESVLHVLRVKTGEVSKIDVIPGAKYAYPSWTPNSDGFYYTRLPTQQKEAIPVTERPGYAAVYYHKLGTDPSKDRLVHEKTGDPKTFISAQMSRSGRFLFLHIMHGWARSDVYYKDLGRGSKRTAAKREAKKAFKPFAVGTKARYDTTAWKGTIYVRTNDGAPRWRLYAVNPRRIKRDKWKLIVPEDKQAVLRGFGIVGGHLSLNYLKNATTLLKVAKLSGKVVRTVSFPGLGSAHGLSGHPEDDTAYFSFSSYIRPTTIYRTSVRKGGREVYYQVKVPVDPKPYMVEQVFYPSKDGTKISMFIIRRKDMEKDTSTPFMLYGYGGFNISLTPHFSGSYFAWLEQGAAIAIPNLRGGGEYGESWHKAGMRGNKQNVFDDFIAAAEWLVKNKYSNSDRIAIRGGSNGGLLVGAAMVQRPSLFAAVACHVPLLDMVRYHRYGSGKTWISEYGTADKAEDFKWLHAYSPYHHVEKTAYPALLMMSADSDDRVDPMHARKFTAAIQHATTSDRPVMMRVETKAGHGGGDMVKKAVEARADEYAFLLKEIGITPKAPGTSQ